MSEAHKEKRAVEMVYRFLEREATDEEATGDGEGSQQTRGSKGSTHKPNEEEKRESERCVKLVQQAEWGAQLQDLGPRDARWVYSGNLQKAGGPDNSNWPCDTAQVTAVEAKKSGLGAEGSGTYCACRLQVTYRRSPFEGRTRTP
jgi:hypothetical protein